MHVSATRARRDIQALRAVAVVAVVLTHVLGWPGGGFAGVDVFFVVSGFLVTGMLLRETADTGRVYLRSFFARRARRLLPAAVVVLTTVVAVAFTLFNRPRAEQTLGDAVAALGLVSNWRFAAEGRDYFSAGEVSPLQHFWSLSVEEQFSLVWPVLVLLALALVPARARRGGAGRATVGLLAAVLVGASAAVAWAQTASDPTAAYFSTLARAGELAVGAVLAAAAPVFARLPRGIGIPVGWAGFALIAMSFVVITPASPFPAPWAALPVSGAALVLAAGVGGDPRHRGLLPLTARPVVAVGDTSYALYLWHFPVVVFAGVLLPAGEAAVGIVLLATVVLAVSTFLGIEQPLHRSPWLAGRRRPVDPVDAPDSAGAQPESPAAVVAPAPAPRPVLTSRPAGWIPGQRYYPGAHPRSVTGEGAVARPLDAPTDGPARPVADGPVRRAAVASAPASDRPLESERDHAWATWWARFRPRVGLAAATLVIGSGATVLALMIVYGAPTLALPPLAAPAPASPAPVSAAADDDGALAALQSELAAATVAQAWPELHPSLDEVMRASSSDNPAHDCFAPDVAPDMSRCTWGSPDAVRHLYLVGDSSAMAYAPALKKLAEDSGGRWRATTVGMYGCRFTDVLVENRDPAVMAACAQRKVDVRALVAADPADLVVVSNAHTLGRSADGRDLGALDLVTATYAEVSAYAPAGRLVFLSPPPHGADLARCYSPVTGPAACLSAVDGVWTEMEAAAEAQAARTGDAAVSALPFSCWQDVCPAFAGDVPVRYDDTHLTRAYAEGLAPLLRHELETRGLY